MTLQTSYSDVTFKNLSENPWNFSTSTGFNSIRNRSFFLVLFGEIKVLQPLTTMTKYQAISVNSLHTFNPLKKFNKCSSSSHRGIFDLNSRVDIDGFMTWYSNLTWYYCYYDDIWRFCEFLGQTKIYQHFYTLLKHSNQ